MPDGTLENKNGRIQEPNMEEKVNLRRAACFRIGTYYGLPEHRSDPSIGRSHVVTRSHHHISNSVQSCLISDTASIGGRDNILFYDPPSTEFYEQKSMTELFNLLSRMYVEILKTFGGKMSETIDVSE